MENLGPNEPADPVIHRIAANRRHAQDRYEHGQVQVALLGEIAADKQQRIARQERRYDKAGLAEDNHEQDQVDPRVVFLNAGTDKLLKVGEQVPDVNRQQNIHSPYSRTVRQADVKPYAYWLKSANDLLRMGGFVCYNPRMSAKKEKVLVAMSGGVDSSVAAILLLREGYDVTGVFLCLGSAGGADHATSGCCSADDATDARMVARSLGIDLHVLNCQADFTAIIDNFVAEYAHGRTPNPCIRCNAAIKFGKLIDLADALGAHYVASGHHARRVDLTGLPAIARARAQAKDQSYALFAVAADNISRILLPIGEIDDKAIVRQIARELKLTVHDKPDSQEICFADGNDYVELLRRRAPQALREGDIVDSEGKVLGRHEGFGATPSASGGD